MKADWRHPDGLNIESVGSVNWLGYLYRHERLCISLLLKIEQELEAARVWKRGLLVLVK